jgi:hypothetical protein
VGKQRGFGWGKGRRVIAALVVRPPLTGLKGLLVMKADLAKADLRPEPR